MTKQRGLQAGSVFALLTLVLLPTPVWAQDLVRPASPPDDPYRAPLSLVEKSRDGDVYSRDINRILCRAATRYGGKTEEWLGTGAGIKCVSRTDAAALYGPAHGLPPGIVVDIAADGPDVAAVVALPEQDWKVCRLNRAADRWETLATFPRGSYYRPGVLYRGRGQEAAMVRLPHPSVLLTPTRLIAFPDEIRQSPTTAQGTPGTLVPSPMPRVWLRPALKQGQRTERPLPLDAGLAADLSRPSPFELHITRAVNQGETLFVGTDRGLYIVSPRDPIHWTRQMPQWNVQNLTIGGNFLWGEVEFAGARADFSGRVHARHIRARLTEASGVVTLGPTELLPPAPLLSPPGESGIARTGRLVALPDGKFWVVRSGDMARFDGQTRQWQHFAARGVPDDGQDAIKTFPLMPATWQTAAPRPESFRVAPSAALVPDAVVQEAVLWEMQPPQVEWDWMAIFRALEGRSLSWLRSRFGYYLSPPPCRPFCRKGWYRSPGTISVARRWAVSEIR